MELDHGVRPQDIRVSPYDRQAWGFGKRGKTGSSRITKAKRGRVYARDGYACVSCGASEGLSIDHKLPVSRGGSNALENLQTMCRPCNEEKGSS